MTLLIGHVSPDTIKLVGHWCSDVMLWYLHTVSWSMMQGHAATMVQYDNYMQVHIPELWDD
eukprot:13989631-Ditylum_brightwellii.AAC.1